MAEDDDLYPTFEADLKEAHARANEMVRALLAHDHDRWREYAEQYSGREKLHLYLAASWWAQWLVKLSGVDDTARVVFFDDDGLMDANHAEAHHLLAADLLRALLGHELDEFAATFAEAPEQVSFDAALFLCAELAQRIRERAQATWN